MRRRLFVAHQDVFDLVLLIQRIVDVQNRATRVAEKEFHAFILQTADEDFGTGQFHEQSLLQTCSVRDRDPAKSLWVNKNAR
jgi:hypothetical protein